MQDYSEWPKSEVVVELRDARESVAFLRDKLAEAEEEAREQWQRSRDVYGPCTSWPASSVATLQDLERVVDGIREDLAQTVEYRDHLKAELDRRETGQIAGSLSTELLAALSLSIIPTTIVLVFVARLAGMVAGVS